MNTYADRSRVHSIGHILTKKHELARAFGLEKETVTEPRMTEPRKTEPRKTERRMTEPRMTEPRMTEPRKTERTSPHFHVCLVLDVLPKARAFSPSTTQSSCFKRPGVYPGLFKARASPGLKKHAL